MEILKQTLESENNKFCKLKELENLYQNLKEKDLWYYYNYYGTGKRSVEVYLGRRKYVLFSTNNYLDLARNKNVINAVIKTVRNCGVGSGASFAVSGGSEYQKKLQNNLSDFYGYEDGLILSSGYMANSAIVTTLIEENIRVFCDKFVHTSFRNALKLHRIEPIRFEHDDIRDLEFKMEESRKNDKKGKYIIITESLFSQHGTIAKIDQISKLAKKYGATLIVDDAHGLGTIGRKGYGILNHYNLNANDVTVITGAMNKSLGSIGGFILSSRDIIEQVKMKAHELIFTSSLPAITLVAADVALSEIKRNQKHFIRLKNNIIYFRKIAKYKDIILPKDITPIIPIVVGSVEKACQLSKRLKDSGIIALPIIPPAVPQDSSCIRIQITAAHKKNDIDKIVALL